MFLGAQGDRTQFVIEVNFGVQISPYSSMNEDEVLLIPGRQACDLAP